MPIWADPCADLDAKARKTSCLQMLNNTVFQNSGFITLFTPEVVAAFFEMVAINLFREIPPTPRIFMAADYEPLMTDIAREHLFLVYSLLTRFLRASWWVPQFSPPFERRFLHLLGVPDVCERELVVAFLVAYVRVFPNREHDIWTRMAHMLDEYTQGELDPYAVTPILSFFSARFPGAREPLFALRNCVFRNSIAPLRTGDHLLSYLPKLTVVVDFFIRMNPSFATEFSRLLIATFPFRRPFKQVPYLNWIICVAGKVPIEETAFLCREFFDLMVRLATSHSSKVVEALLKVWSTVGLLPMIMDHARTIYPKMHPAITGLMCTHWRLSTRVQAMNALETMQEIDPQVFGDLQQIARKRMEPSVGPLEFEDPTQKNWAIVIRKAGRRDRNLQVAVLLTKLFGHFGTPPPTCFPWTTQGI
jgi:hypothetical protein